MQLCDQTVWLMSKCDHPATTPSLCHAVGQQGFALTSQWKYPADLPSTEAGANITMLRSGAAAALLSLAGLSMTGPLLVLAREMQLSTLLTTAILRPVPLLL